MRLVNWSVGFRERILSENDVRSFLSDHDRWTVQIAAHDARHDRGIDDPESINTCAKHTVHVVIQDVSDGHIYEEVVIVLFYFITSQCCNLQTSL